MYTRGKTLRGILCNLSGNGWAELKILSLSIIPLLSSLKFGIVGLDRLSFRPNGMPKCGCGYSKAGTLREKRNNRKSDSTLLLVAQSICTAFWVMIPFSKEE